MNIAIVAARSSNGVIGRGLEIPWRVKGEQKLFRDITMGGTLIMGRRTYESIGRPLPGRKTIVVSKSLDTAPDECTLARNLSAAIDAAKGMNRPIFIAGGGEIYRQALPLADTVHLTTIQAVFDGNVFFPSFPTEDFALADEHRFESNIDYIYQVFNRKAAD